MDGSDLTRRLQQARQKAELLGTLRRIEATVASAIAIGSLDAYESALDEVYELTCNDDEEEDPDPDGDEDEDDD